MGRKTASSSISTGMNKVLLLFQICLAQFVETLHMRWVNGIAELGLLHAGFLCHQRCVFLIFDHRDTARDAGFAIHETPGKHANGHAAVEQKIDLTTDAFSMDNAIWEHFQMHELV